MELTKEELLLIASSLVDKIEQLNKEQYKVEWANYSNMFETIIGNYKKLYDKVCKEVDYD